MWRYLLCISLPCLCAAAKSHVRPAEAAPEASRYITRGLREAGHVVALADNGPDGLSMASDEEHDVLIVDRMLPSIDGLSVIETLRNQNSPLPILILSALGDLEDRVQGLRAGGDDYLP